MYVIDSRLTVKSGPLRKMLATGFSLVAALSVAIVSLSGCHSNPVDTSSTTNSGGDQALAENIYDVAWKMIKEEYVDGSYNGQDWDQWRTKFQGQLQNPDDAYVAVATMVASLNDQYTRILPPRAMSDQNMSIDSKLFGVGIQISIRNGQLLVVSTLDGTPAEAAGLLPKDLIIGINGHVTTGMSVEDAADHIRGVKGTFVTLKIKRGDKSFEKKIVRAEIKLKSVFSKPMTDPKIGYVRLSSFISESMMSEFDEIMKGQKEKQALIIDLRGNYGGLFTNAVEIADQLLDSGKIVSIVNREKEQQAFDAHPGEVFRNPIVLLIDGGSASSSEIFAGALKDNKRATLIGSQSFGKGLVQKINNLPNGAGLNITISTYLTPNGTYINKKGIEPDVKVPYTEADFLAQRDPQLKRAVQFLEKQIATAPVKAVQKP